MGILEKMRLDGKVSFVTGGARGIGKAIAQALAEAGSDLALIDIDIEETEKTAGEIEKETGKKSDRHSGRCNKTGRGGWYDEKDHGRIRTSGRCLLQCGNLYEYPGGGDDL